MEDEKEPENIDQLLSLSESVKDYLEDTELTKKMDNKGWHEVKVYVKVRGKGFYFDNLSITPMINIEL